MFCIALNCTALCFIVSYCVLYCSHVELHRMMLYPIDLYHVSPGGAAVGRKEEQAEHELRQVE